MMKDELEKQGYREKPVVRPRDVPLWEGPSGKGWNGGVTFSMLSRFLVCRERFRIHYMEGLRPFPTFNHRIEYGNMWHVCEEAHAKGPDPTNKRNVDRWREALLIHCRGLCDLYPLQQEQVVHWMNVCRTQFPIYVEHWSLEADVVERRPILQEQVFDVPYTLPSGRTVRLRGKWDSVDVIGCGSDAAVYLQENKTKSEIDELQVRRQLTFDLQAMLYIVVLYQDTGIDRLEEVKHWDGKRSRTPIGGIRYNVVRRPLSGGRGSIVRHKATKSKPEETHDEFYGRLSDIIREDVGSFFARWKIDVRPTDVLRFQTTCLDPILENLCQWWDHVTDKVEGAKGLFGIGGAVDACPHWRHPFGVYNVLDEGGSSDVDEYLATGSTVGLVQTDALFEELREGGDA